MEISLAVMEGYVLVKIEWVRVSHMTLYVYGNDMKR